MYRRYLIKKKGDEMLTKETAKDIDVYKAVIKSSEKHSKMLGKLSK
jgi:hypothetical protein